MENLYKLRKLQKKIASLAYAMPIGRHFKHQIQRCSSSGQYAYAYARQIWKKHDTLFFKWPSEYKHTKDITSEKKTYQFANLCICTD